jgi:NADPH:quinone reductase-like Zn-dependent oxidoreductase
LIIVTGTSKDAARLRKWRCAGRADHVVDVQKEDPLSRVMEILTGGKGVDVVLDCNGRRRYLPLMLLGAEA